MFGLHILDLLAILLFFVSIVVIGVLARHYVSEGEEGFFLGGRSFGKIVSVFLAFGAGTSSDTAVVASRETYRSGMSGVWAMLLWLFITPFYWIIAPWWRRLRVVTFGDFFEDRFNSRPLAALYVVFGLLWLMYHAAVGFTAVGKTVEIVTAKPESAYTTQERENVEAYEEFEALEARSELTRVERERYEELERQANQGTIRAFYAYLPSRYAVPIIGLIVILYGTIGGLAAAAWTDTLQGILIIVLTFLLLPNGLAQMGGLAELHEKVPAYMFDLVGSEATSDYTWFYVLALVSINLVGITVRPHLIATGGGGAKDERSAQIGMVGGNLLKRFSTILWGFTGVLAFGLFSEAVSDPDMIWGYATQQLLGPGLIGLMIAALIAASMSSADAFMLAGSALYTRNVHRPLFPERDEQHYVWVGRIISVAIIAGAICIALYFGNILAILQYSWQLPVIFGIVFWLSILWRRVTEKAALITVCYSFLTILILPLSLPQFDTIATSENLLISTHERRIEVEAGATAADVRSGRADEVGEVIMKEQIKEPVPIFFEDIIATGDPATPRRGAGALDTNLLALHALGVDLRSFSGPGLTTASYFMTLIVPFLLLFVLSLRTQVPDERVTDRFFARFHTPAYPDPEKDKAEVAKSLENPRRFESKKLFPGSSWEIMRPTRGDTIGFLVVVVSIFLMLGFAYLVANLQVF